MPSCAFSHGFVQNETVGRVTFQPLWISRSIVCWLYDCGSEMASDWKSDRNLTFFSAPNCGSGVRTCNCRARSSICDCFSDRSSSLFSVSFSKSENTSVASSGTSTARHHTTSASNAIRTENGRTASHSHTKPMLGSLSRPWSVPVISSKQCLLLSVWNHISCFTRLANCMSEWNDAETLPRTVSCWNKLRE